MINILVFLILLWCLIIIFCVKNYLVLNNSRIALDFIYSHDNYMELIEKYDPAKSYSKNLFHPLRWTYKQMFRGLEDGSKN